MVLAADSTTLVIPKITKPLVEPVKGDPLQADYVKMWTAYEEAIETAKAKITEALEKQSDKAADTGELELVEMWEGMKKQFAESGMLEWDTSPKAAIERKKKNPKVPYPKKVAEAVRSASTLADNASGKLDEGYTTLVKAYTKAKNIPRAKELRAEASGLMAGSPATPKAASLKQNVITPQPNSHSLADRLKGTRWINSNNVTFEWTTDGSLLHRGRVTTMASP